MSDDTQGQCSTKGSCNIKCPITPIALVLHFGMMWCIIDALWTMNAQT